MRDGMKLLVVAGMVALSTGCLQMDVTLRLGATGDGSFSSSVVIGETLTRVMDSMGSVSPEMGRLMSEGMPRKLKGKDLRALEAEGFRDVKVEVSRSKKETGWRLSGGFSDFTDLPAFGERVGGAVPSARVYALEDGTYVLAWTPGKQGEEKPKADTPEMNEKAMKEMMDSIGDFGKIMADMATFRMAMTAEVPGEVISVEPNWGTVDGRSVTWVISASELMSQAANPGAGKPDLPDAFQVRFRATAPFPEGLISAGPVPGSVETI